MSHNSCGAASARVDPLSITDGEPAEVVDPLFHIQPAVAGIASQQTRAKQIPQAVRQNVEQSVRRPSAIYGVHTGKVAFH